MPAANQQCYTILSHPATYDVFNAKPTANLIHSNIAGASVSLSTMRNTNTIIVSSPATINATQVTSYPLHSTMPPPLAASKTKQISNETIVIPSDWFDHIESIRFEFDDTNVCFDWFCCWTFLCWHQSQLRNDRRELFIHIESADWFEEHASNK